MDLSGDLRFEISQIDAGSTQLDMAIRLHFQVVSEVAARTLAAAAAVFFQGLVDIKYRRMRLQHISKTLDVRDEIYIDALQNAQWLLHYPRERLAYQSWLLSETELLLMAAILNIEELTVSLSTPQLVFKLWYFAKQPATLSGRLPATQAAVAAAFPQLHELSEPQQRLAGIHRIEMEERQTGSSTGNS